MLTLTHTHTSTNKMSEEKSKKVVRYCSSCFAFSLCTATCYAHFFNGK